MPPTMPNAHEIIPGLWLGNRAAAVDDDFLARHQISTVFNCTKDTPFNPRIPRQYRLPVDDNLQAEEVRNMTLWSQEAVYKVLSEYNRGNRILIHCYAGVQRSAALTAMTLIAMKGMSCQDAMAHIQRIRPIAFRPAANFQTSIEAFEDTYRTEILPMLSR